MTALENFTPLIGGIPITVDGQIVGGVGVSGAASADQDEQLAIAGSKAFEPNAMSGDPAPTVSYWEKNKVDEAFSKGAFLGKFDAALTALSLNRGVYESLTGLACIIH